MGLNPGAYTGYEFCKACGRMVKIGGEFCNEKCQKAYERKRRPRQRKKYGVGGEIYNDKRYVQLNQREGN